MRVLIVDDHPIARIGLSAVVEEALPAVSITHAASVSMALAVAAESSPDLVLADMNMPGSVPTRELCVQLRAFLPGCIVVLVTAHANPGDVRDCLEAGASGCLLKDTDEETLVSTLRSILDGRVCIDPRVAQDIVVDLAGGRAAATAIRLTGRERDVLRCLADGCSNRQIAAELILTESTVKGYVSKVMDKLGASSRLEAVVRAGESGIL